MALFDYCTDVKAVLSYTSEVDFIHCITIALKVANTSTTSWTKNNIGMRKARLIDMRHHFLKVKVAKANLNPVNANSGEHFAETFTKPLSDILFNTFCDVVGMEKVTVYSQGKCECIAATNNENVSPMVFPSLVSF